MEYSTSQTSTMTRCTDLASPTIVGSPSAVGYPINQVCVCVWCVCVVCVSERVCVVCVVYVHVCGVCVVCVCVCVCVVYVCGVCVCVCVVYVPYVPYVCVDWCGFVCGIHLQFSCVPVYILVHTLHHMHDIV